MNRHRILIAACTSARDAFELADTQLDSDLCDDRSRMIERTQAELEQISLKITGAAFS